MGRNKDFDDKFVADDEEAPVLYVELADQRGSGFILDGTRGTDREQELKAPKARFIPNRGYRRSVKTEMRNGKKVETKFNEPIRYIKEQTEISVAKQRELGIEPNRSNKEDMIEFKMGNFSVVREGSFIGLYDYIEQSFYNQSNLDRSLAATAIYKVVKLGQQEEDLNEYDAALADALKFVAQFYERTSAGKYRYKEDKIDALCNLFIVYGETMAGKVTALNALAKRDPVFFMKKAEKFEQTNIAIVAQAINLNVIAFKQNTLEYVAKEKIILNLGTESMTQTRRIERAAELLETPDFKAAKEELILELEVEKERQLNA